MYETERLIQELFKFEIDVRNIVINQVIFDEGNDILNVGNHCKMCTARRKMQKKYMDQIKELFEDFHIVTLPLQEEEVRGIERLVQFSNLLVNPPPFK
jgi:arsenite-transporting ATPase